MKKEMIYLKGDAAIKITHIKKDANNIDQIVFKELYFDNNEMKVISENYSDTDSSGRAFMNSTNYKTIFSTYIEQDEESGHDIYEAIVAVSDENGDMLTIDTLGAIPIHTQGFKPNFEVHHEVFFPARLSFLANMVSNGR